MVQRVPIRIVQENGNRIDLDVQTMDINIRRVFSAFPIPFTGGFNAGIDLNQASVEIELQGVFADESGQEASQGASATIEFGSDELPPFGNPGQGSGQGEPEVFPPSTNVGTGFRLQGQATNPWASGPVIPTRPPTTSDGLDAERERILNRYHGREFHIPLAYQVANGPAVPPNGDYVRFIFDSKRSGSSKEPFSYPYMRRTTDITVASNTLTSNSNGTLRVLIATGDPRSWIETPDDPAFNAVSIAVGGTLFGIVHATAAASIDFFPVSGITAGMTPSGTVEIIPRGLGVSPYDKTTDPPIIAVPIKHMFDENPPNFADGSARSVGTATSPGEVLVHIFSQALQTAPASSVGDITDRDLVAGGRVLSDAFLVEVTGRYANHNVKITQKHASDMGSQGEILCNIPADIKPVINPFTGGIAGNKVKSAGDKVQDILGIVANSQNYQQNNNGTQVGSLLDGFNKLTEIMEQRPTDLTTNGDYIIGIQIPYESSVSLGLSLLDTDIAQRNFYTTFGDAKTNEKTGVKNDLHASLGLNPSARKHRTNGIKAVVTDFVTMHDAQERLYNFTMKLIAVDSLL